MKARGALVRFLLVSATVPNIRDIAEWVGNPTVSDGAPATIYEVRIHRSSFILFLIAYLISDSLAKSFARAS